jgi:small-conductance mechanosensitive channel
LTVRRIVVAAVVLVIIIASVVSEFGSLVTFVGLITAGIAVALQTVILSGVAYFFFIGRFGVRVGDRVTINGITGDVVEIGLFRIYLMELGGPKIDLHATGRIVVFSNAVLFQPQAFYKQIPGADYVWHEISFTLAPDTDYHTAEDRLLGAVDSVYDEYRSEVENQYRETSGTMQVAMEAPKPTGRLRFVDSGLEFAVRFPVPLRRASEIDDKITRHLLDAVNAEPRLKMVPTSTPKIQAA